MDSILTSIKKLLGITEEYEHFDADLIMHINSVFMVLTQLGIGPDRGFTIKDDSAIWADFVPEEPVLEAVKSFVYLKVKLLFDPPLNSSVIESMNRQISEFEWRINIAAESLNRESSETEQPNTSDGGTDDYEKLKNLPSINGEKLIGNYDEKDPNVAIIPPSVVDELWAKHKSENEEG